MIAEKPRVFAPTSTLEFAKRYVATIAISDAETIRTGYVEILRPPSGRGSLSSEMFIGERDRGNWDKEAKNNPKIENNLLCKMMSRFYFYLNRRLRFRIDGKMTVHRPKKSLKNRILE